MTAVRAAVPMRPGPPRRGRITVAPQVDGWSSGSWSGEVPVGELVGQCGLDNLGRDALIVDEDAAGRAHGVREALRPQVLPHDDDRRGPGSRRSASWSRSSVLTKPSMSWSRSANAAAASAGRSSSSNGRDLAVGLLADEHEVDDVHEFVLHQSGERRDDVTGDLVSSNANMANSTGAGAWEGSFPTAMLAPWLRRPGAQDHPEVARSSGEPSPTRTVMSNQASMRPWRTKASCTPPSSGGR